jgi:hypothetical protein
MQFVNDAKPQPLAEHQIGRAFYQYDQPSKYLAVYGRLLQGVISQAATYLLTAAFHDRDTAIHVSEGGCYIHGVGELVLLDRSCHFTSYHVAGRGDRARQDDAERCAGLITHVVIRFDPMQPIESLIEAATDYLAHAVDGDINVARQLKPELRAALEASVRQGGPFSGNALSCFFERVRGYDSRKFYDSLRDYRRYCMTTFDDKTDADVDRDFADVDLGRKLHDALRAEYEVGYGSVMCCVPERISGELKFWINASKSTGLETGWFTQAEVEKLLKEGSE